MSFSIRLPEAIDARLDHLAAETGRTKKFYVMQAIERELEDLEDIYLSEKRLIDIRTGKSKTVPLEEVMKRYGLEG